MNLQQSLRIITYGASKTVREGKRVVIDFSSPNIAKPFHFGHLKSTILGNFLANINKYYGNHVTKLNYIGDWGTQYGLLSLGLEEEKEHNQHVASTGKTSYLEHSPLEHLLDIYIEANKRGKEDESFYERARQRFQSMDSGQDAEQLARWRQIRDISLNELKSSYRLLGIDFDVFECESEHAIGARELVERMKSLNHIKTLGDGVLVTEVVKNNRLMDVPLLKSDGSSLYMTRDITAAFHRRDKYNFDRMLYVVGSDQERHFHCLREIVRKFDGCAWADNLVHVKMGKIIGMSSRSGNALLLSKIIDEATRTYVESTRNVPTSKVKLPSEIEEVGRHLALSALFVFDMRNKRTRNYEFDWAQVMAPGDRSGIHLQTTHARLCNLLKNSLVERELRPYETVDEINYDSICCVEGVHLINVMNELDKKLEESYQAMDPSYLVNHALILSKAANRARRSDWLHVIKEPDPHKARSRLTLFESARSQLELIIRMIGLKPLANV